MSSELPPLPNPLTPLAWLPVDIASQLEASRYLYAAVIGAWIWDVLMALPDDYRMLTKQKRPTYSDIVYVLARLASGAFIATSLVFQVGAVGNCHALAKAIGWCGAFALPLNSLLFFFRVTAVFNQDKYIVGLFAFLWVATFACTLTAPFGVDGIHIGTTQNCINSDVKPYSSAGLIVVAVNDTSVFIAISAKLLMYALAERWIDRLKSFFSGTGMGVVSRMLLQTGQLYYLVTVGVNIIAMVVILTPSVPPVLRAMFSIPNLALQNAMACRVYRLLKLGLLKDNPVISSGTATSKSFRFTASNARLNAEGTFITGETRQDATLVESIPMRVDIRRETDVTVDVDSDKGSWKVGQFV